MKRALLSLCQRAALVALLATLAASTSGCAATIVYAVKASNASSKLEQARTLGAAEYAEYEYFYAEAHLDKAAEEAAYASYGDAIEFADIAEEYAQKAIDLSKDAHRGAGR